MKRQIHSITEAPSSNGRDNKQSYKDLLVWQKGMDLATRIYWLRVKIPAIEKYGLKSQLQRAVVSIPSNIAEGQARGGKSH